jgi:hypothetical protein
MTSSNKINKSVLLALSLFLCTTLANAEHHESDSSTASEQQKAKHHDGKFGKRKHRRGRHMDMQMERLDTNEDGKIDLNEYLTHAESRFNAMDANGDSAVTKQEANQHHKLMRRKHHEKMQKKNLEKHAEKLAEKIAELESE